MEKIVELINENKINLAQKELLDKDPIDIAYLLEELDPEKSLIVFRILPKDTAVEVFSHISKESQIHIGQSITSNELSNIVNELYLDDSVDFLEELPANMVKKILQNTEKQKRDLINQFLNYPEDSAGSIMTIEYVELKKEITVKEALAYIRKTAIDKETIDTCYVINSKRKLEGIVPIRKLIFSDENTTIEEIMIVNLIRGNTQDDQEQIAAIFKKYNFTTLPVVDNEMRLVGIITIDDVVDIIEQENTEDFHRMAAIQPSEDSYLKTNAITLAKHRITWLLVLMISATFTGRIMQNYEQLLASMIILTSFIPMIMDTGGNSGSQSSTLVIRSIALGEIDTTDTFKVIKKELQVGVIVGIVLAAANFLRLYFLEAIDAKVALTVTATLLFVVVIAKVTGGILPLIAKVLRLDPAIMAGPLITTIVDAAALMIYFKLASVLLGI